MLTPDYLETLPDEITKLYEQIEEDILADMARRIAKADYVTDTAAWQYERMRASGAAHDYILRQLQRKTGKTYKALEKLFEDAVGEALQADDKIYAQAGLSPPRLRDSPELLQIIESGLDNTLGLFQNLTRTTASAGQQQFVTALDRAWLQITSGAFDYQTAIRRAIRDIAASGLHAVRYPSGRVDKLDVATRRAALTGVSQTAGKISLARAQQMGAKFMELTAHAGARPSHAAWQGQVVSLEGAPGYLSLDDIGYGTGGGFKGWNCRHDWFPFFPGISESAYPRGELERLNNATVPYQGKDVPVYEAMQKQRAMERKIRESKREVSALDAVRQTNTKLNLDADFNRAAMELKRREAALKGYLKETGLNRDRSREQVQGFGRSQSSKAAWVNRKGLQSNGSSGIIKANKLGKREAPVRYSSSQEEIDSLLKNELKGIRFSASITYNPRLRASYGQTKAIMKNGRLKSLTIEISKQARPGKAEIIDTILHEEMEARIIKRAYKKNIVKYKKMDALGEQGTHPYLLPRVKRYLKLKGWI